jgi:hypothetical protein
MMIITYFILAIILTSTVIMKFIHNDEIHHLIFILSMAVTLSGFFLGSPLAIKFIISCGILLLCEYLYVVHGKA